MLALLRDNRAIIVQNLMTMPCLVLLQASSTKLNILDPETGNRGLVECVAAEMARMNA